MTDSTFVSLQGQGKRKICRKKKTYISSANMLFWQVSAGEELGRSDLTWWQRDN